MVSCCSYVVTSLLAAYLFLRTPGHSARAALVPRGEDLRDYVRLARRGASTLGPGVSVSASSLVRMSPENGGRGIEGRNFPLAIEARGSEKTFRIPTHRIDSLKERADHLRPARVPRAAGPARRIVRRPAAASSSASSAATAPGRARSLKILAGIDAADAGRSRWPGASRPSSSSASASTRTDGRGRTSTLNGVMMG